MTSTADAASLPTRRLVLASASPRRRQLLEMIGARFTVVISRFDERLLGHLTDGAEYVRVAASRKAEEVATRRDGVILGVDTDVVAPGGDILGKPDDANAARAMLRRLSAQTHQVYSGIVLLEVSSGQITRRQERVVRTDVTFAALSDEAINAYVASGDPLDKAGSYGIQSGGLAFVSEIRGDLSSVIGLPVAPLTEMLTTFDIPLWQSK